MYHVQAPVPEPTRLAQPTPTGAFFLACFQELEAAVPNESPYVGGKDVCAWDLAVAPRAYLARLGCKLLKVRVGWAALYYVMCDRWGWGGGGVESARRVCALQCPPS